MSSQEAAWFLLRMPMSYCSVVVVYIPTCWPIERERIRKTRKELDELDDLSTDIWKENWFDKYQKRPAQYEEVTLAQFVSKYNVQKNGNLKIREITRVIRYTNYDISDILNYKREMVTLHIPFRNEEADILSEMKFLNIYDENENVILEKRKEFEKKLDIHKVIELCRQLCREDILDDAAEQENNINAPAEQDLFQQIMNNPNAEANLDIRMATLNKLGSIARKRDNLMERSQFLNMMRSANTQRRELLMHIIDNLQSEKPKQLKLFLTGPTGCGKTFTIRLIMDIYNRFTDNSGFSNAYINCAYTGNAACAIDGVTIHSAFKIIPTNIDSGLSVENINLFRTLFQWVKVTIIDEVSMCCSELLCAVDKRLRNITGNKQTPYGGMDVLLIGDLRQLPPVNATAIYNQPKVKHIEDLQRHTETWENLSFFALIRL